MPASMTPAPIEVKSLQPQTENHARGLVPKLPAHPEVPVGRTKNPLRWQRGRTLKVHRQALDSALQCLPLDPDKCHRLSLKFDRWTVRGAGQRLLAPLLSQAPRIVLREATVLGAMNGY